MSKLADELRKHQIYNSHGLLSKFGDPGRDLIISYIPAEGRTVRANMTTVWSPTFMTDPNSAWYDHGKKTFVGKRAESWPKAVEWATATYEITEWAVCPFGGAWVPKYALDRAKAFVKGKK